MSESLQERYSAIERLYSQGQWQQVLESSQTLLDALADQPEDSLRARLSLLQGHTLLYGLGRPQDAALIYQQVLDSRPDPVLHGIAEQELQRCRNQTAAQPQAIDLAGGGAGAVAGAGAGSEFPFVAEAVGSAAAGQSAAAMPWLQALEGADVTAVTGPQEDTVAQPAIEALPTIPITPPTVVDIVDEPEQLEVVQADASGAEVVELIPTTPLEVKDTPEQDIDQMGLSSAEAAELAKGLLTVVLG